MDSEQTLIIAAVIVGGVAILSLSKPLSDITSVIPYAENKFDRIFSIPSIIYNDIKGALH